MGTSASEPTTELVQRALESDSGALRALVDQLTPVIQARVARALLRRAEAAAGRNIRQEVEDLTQEVFVALFSDGGRALRAWDPRRGLSLLNFVGFLAERQIAAILRTARRSPWTEDPTLVEDLDVPADSGPGLEGVIESQQLLGALLDRLRENLSPLGLSLFEMLWVQQRSTAEVCAETGMSRDAVYAWQSRLGKLARRLGGELMSENGASAHRPQQGGTK